MDVQSTEAEIDSSGDVECDPDDELDAERRLQRTVGEDLLCLLVLLRDGESRTMKASGSASPSLLLLSQSLFELFRKVHRGVCLRSEPVSFVARLCKGWNALSKGISLGVVSL